MNGMDTTHPLDNPIWSALTTRQAHFAETSDHARRFPLEVTSLGGFSEPSQEGYDSIAALQSADEATGLFLTDRASLRGGWTVVDEAPLLQMVCESNRAIGSTVAPTPTVEWIEL